MSELHKSIAVMAVVALVMAACPDPLSADDPKPKAILKGHTDEVYAIVYSPDGKTLASAGQDTSIRLWDLATGKERLILNGNVKNKDWQKNIYALAFSPDGKTLASGGSEHAIRLLDTATGKVRATLEKHIRRVMGLAYTPDGSTLVSGGWDGSILVWDTATNKVRVALDAKSGVERLALSPDGKLVASGHNENWIQVWDVGTGKRTNRFGGQSTVFPISGISSLSFSPDAKTLGSAIHAQGNDGKDLKDRPIRLWDVATGKQRVALEGRHDTIAAVDFSPDGKTLASGDWGGLLKLWDLATGKELATVKADEDPDVPGLYALAFSPDGKTVATAGSDHNVRLWDVATVTEAGK
jgi:WD40 repeat protein